MKVIKIIIIAMLQWGFGIQELQAQEATSATGGNASGGNGSVSYTVGQVVYTTNTNTAGTVSQGVQQPYEIFIITSIEEAKGITLQCSAYPNPTSDFLTLKVENVELSTFIFQLYDVSGKLLENKKIESNETSIFMKNLVPSNYFLKILENNKELKTFKIIKN